MAAQARFIGLIPERWLRTALESVDSRLDRFSNPILLKELRLMLQAKLFVATHVAILAIAGLYSFGSIGMHWVETGGRWAPSAAELGQSLYAGIQWIQGIAICLLVPAMAATTISSEREGKTLDMLLSSFVRPGRVLAGKFLAPMSLVFVVLLSLYPVALASWVIGGVGFWLVIRFYIAQAMLGTLMVAVSILISSVARASYQAILGSYVAALAVQWSAFPLFDLLETWRLGPFARELYGIESVGVVELNLLWMTPREFWCAVALPVGAWGGMLLLSIAGSLCAITPPHSASSAPLKMAYLVVVALAVIVFAGLANGLPAAQAPSVLFAGALTLLVLLTGGSIFIGEEIFGPSEGSGRWPWVLRTGSKPSLAFCLSVSILATAGFLFGHRSAGLSAFELAALLLGWSWFCAGLMLLLRLAIRQVEAARLLFGVLVIVLMALPPIVGAILGNSFGSAGNRWVMLAGPASAAYATALAGTSSAVWTGIGYGLAGVFLMVPAIPHLARRRERQVDLEAEGG